MKSKSGKNEPLATKAAVTEKAREGRLSFASNTGFLMTCTATVGAAGTANQWMSLPIPVPTSAPKPTPTPNLALGGGVNGGVGTGPELPPPSGIFRPAAPIAPGW